MVFSTFLYNDDYPSKPALIQHNKCLNAGQFVVLPRKKMMHNFTIKKQLNPIFSLTSRV